MKIKIILLSLTFALTSFLSADDHVELAAMEILIGIWVNDISSSTEVGLWLKFLSISFFAEFNSFSLGIFGDNP